MKAKNNFWVSAEANCVHEMENPERETIQPEIAKLIHRYAPSSLLDYGCGDGFINTIIDKSIDKYLYDINHLYIRELKQKIREKDDNFTIVESVDSLPHNFFDCVLLSFVQPCISNEEEYDYVLSNIKTLKKKDGILIITNPHPCFLQYKFASFRTEFSTNDKLTYFGNAQKFRMTLRDNNGNLFDFDDYHYQLSYAINKLLFHGFELVKMIEYPDMALSNKENNENKKYSPFYTLICK